MYKSGIPHGYHFKFFFSLFWGVIISFTSYNQPLPTGVPPIKNFSKKTFQAAPQNWDIIQSQNQIMYFANNLGLLSFDGAYWNVCPIGNKTILRSICLMDNQTIMAGGQGDVGYFDFDKSGKTFFVSLTDKMPEGYGKFGDVWHMESLGDSVFFNTARDVFVWDGQIIRAFPFKNRIEKLAKIDQEIWIYAENGSLYQWIDQSFQQKTTPLAIQSPVTGIERWNQDTLVISTLKDGLFYYHNGKIGTLATPWNNYFKKNWIYKIIRLKDQNIAIATVQNGVFVFNAWTNTSMALTTSEGLQSNNVLSLFQDHVGDLWIGSEHGIDLIQYHSPYRLLFPDGNLKGAGYAAAVHKDQLYLGTTNGVYKHFPSDHSDSFREIPGSKGQVWKLDTVNERLFLGHHQGAFEIKDNQLIPIFTQAGTWKFIPIDNNYIAFGTYDGVGVFNQNTGNNYSGLLPDFEESSRIMVKDKMGTIWMSHPYRGVFQLQIDPVKNEIKATKMTSEQGLDSDLGNYIFQIGGIPFVCSESAIYQYQHDQKTFVRDTLLESKIGNKKRIQLLYESPSGDIWYHTPAGGGILEISDYGLKKEVGNRVLPPLPEKLLGGFEFILELDTNQYIFGCEQGFVLLKKEALKKENQYNTFIHAVYLAGANDTLIYRGNPKVEDMLPTFELKPNQNAVRFLFSTASFGEELKEFRYQLEGLEAVFSDWTTNTEVQFNNLSPGNYYFTVQARVGDKIQESEAVFAFRIATPWYQMKVVQGLAVILVLTFIFAFFFLQRKKFESEKLELESLHQEAVEEKTQLVEKTEQEIVQLKNEKLQSEIQHKNNELASTTMHLVQKQELLSGIEDELKKVLKQNDTPKKQKQDLLSIIQMLQQDARVDDDWERFTSYFDEVHGYFLHKLKDKYPQLTLNDHKLCAYLRMNLSSKEIASLLNISLRGVEGGRYRLRKKLNLPQDTNLVEFMQQIE